MSIDIAVLKAALEPARKNETPEDVVKAMQEYADAMDVRQKEAVKPDRYLMCSCIALRMREFVLRMEKALARQGEADQGVPAASPRNRIGETP